MTVPNIGLTVLPEKGGMETLLRSRLTVLCRLESSLGESRRAFVALDLAGIEHGTREQAALVGELEALLAPGIQGVEGRADPSAEALELEAEIRRSAKRVWDAVRLQAALLKRGRAKLCVLGNMLAGPSRAYGPGASDSHLYDSLLHEPWLARKRKRERERERGDADKGNRSPRRIPENSDSCQA